MTTATTAEARRLRYRPAAELALAVVTLAVVYGFRRVFTTDDFAPVLVTAGYSCGILVVTRRRGFGIVSSLLIGAVGLVLVLTYLFFADTTRFALPSGATLDATRAALSSSWSTFQNVVAPAPPEDGFLLAASVAVFFAAFLADWAAFRLWSTFEAIIPATTLFIFCALLGSTEHRIDSVVVFALATVAFVLIHRIARRESSTAWVTDDVHRGSDSWARTGAVVGMAALAIGLIGGSQLPGADAGAIVSWRGSDGPKGDRFTVSPLVEINSRLVQQSDTELFTVQADRPAYWRLTSLDTFDGSSWRSKGRFTVADGDLDVTRPSTGTSTELDQSYHITNLARLWIPAAYQVDRIEDAPARYEAASGTLIVDTSAETSDGLQYTVRSAVPNYTADQLRTATTGAPDDIRSRYLDLPADFADSDAARQARIHTAGASTDYDRARLLQDWFRDNFEYSLEVQPGHSESAIDDFLRNRQGYCEQFAGSYAAMARSLGLPARVAVGFTWGDPDPSNPGLYHVKGRHAHAWPEVYLGSYGWVAFEPTPSRGAPDAAAWTGVEAGQASSSTTGTSTTTSIPTTTAATGDGAGQPAATVPDLATPTTTAPPAVLNQGGGPAELITGNPARSVIVGLIGLFLVLGLLGVPAAHAARRRQRRRRAGTDPSGRIRLVWEESLEELALVGAVPAPNETHDEFATRAGVELPDAAGALNQLARATDAATFAPDLVDDHGLERARSAAGVVAAVVDTRVSRMARLRHRLDPRPLLRPRGRRQPWHDARADR